LIFDAVRDLALPPTVVAERAPLDEVPDVSKLSRLLPLRIACRSHAGRGPRPPQELPCPSLYLAFVEASECDDDVAAEAARRPPEVDVAPGKWRSSAVNPYAAIDSLSLATTALISAARSFSADACKAWISRVSWA